MRSIQLNFLIRLEAESAFNTKVSLFGNYNVNIPSIQLNSNIFFKVMLIFLEIFESIFVKIGRSAFELIKSNVLAIANSFEKTGEYVPENEKSRLQKQNTTKHTVVFYAIIFTVFWCLLKAILWQKFHCRLPLLKKLDV